MQVGMRLLEQLEPALIQGSGKRSPSTSERGFELGRRACASGRGLIMTLKSCQQLAHQLASEVIRDSVPGKLAGTHQVGPQGLATFADQFHGQKAFERGLRVTWPVVQIRQVPLMTASACRGSETT